MKVYKLKDTTEPGAIIMRITSRKLTEIEHSLIPLLPGDLFLVFPEGITKFINPLKFSRLYGATWYGVYKDDQVGGIWGALDYLESITKYTSISVVLNNFSVNKDKLGGLRKLQYSGIETSVFSREELGMKEKADIYTIKSKLIDLAFGFRIRLREGGDNKGMYASKKTLDPIVFLRPGSIRKMRDEISPEILHSFYGLGPGSFIASMIPPETYINVRTDEAKV